MIATIINAAAIILGSLIGLLMKAQIKEKYQDVIYTTIGISTLVIGMSMALASQRVLYMVLSLVVGGLVGTLANIEGGVLSFGEFLKKILRQKDDGNTSRFAYGFLDASVLFCVGAMAILGSLQAGAEGKFDILLTKSVMDGFIAILMTAALGIGVAFSALPVFAYQGLLTLLAGSLSPLISPLMLSELRGVGGVLVIMIGFNLLKLRSIKTANYLPAIVIVVLFAALEPVFIH